MKGYKFKLEPVLKIRKMKEEQCKAEIGKLQVLITKWRTEISRHDAGIKEAYESQEVGLKDGMNGQAIQFYPYFISGKQAHISQIKTEIGLLEEQVKAKFHELKSLRADLKVIEKMKEKDQTKYKKDLNKRQFQEMEEQVQNWKQALKLD